MLTNRGKYGLKALVHLANLPSGQVALASDIARFEDIPKKFLDTILNDLRNAGFVHTKKGPGGGYMLARPASEISAGEVIRSLGGPVVTLACANRTAFVPCDDCTDAETCAVRSLMLELADAAARVLDKTSIDTLRERTAGPGQLMYYI